MTDVADVVIIGGAMIGSSIAWWLSRDFDGRIVVVERNPSYEWASTTHTNSCIRQQFGSEVNIRLSRFTLDFMRDLKGWMADDEAPEIALHDFGYLYLAADEGFADVLRRDQKLQTSLGAGTVLLERDEVAERFPFMVTDDVRLASFGSRDEGYFDGATLFDWFRRKARHAGVTYVADEVVGIDVAEGRATGVRLASGQDISAGIVVNASGPRAALTARMAGLDLPVEPRKRYSFVFDAAEPLDRPLPLTIDPSGVHVRSEGRYYLAGCPPFEDGPVAPDDFVEDHTLWEEKVWPAIATRIPAFERVRLMRSWVGHYAYNTFDQNAILGPHPELPNFLFTNGFSGHGLQQAAGVGRGIAELIRDGQYTSLDLTPLGIERLFGGAPTLERAII
ncbi:NAD(P)/FAD-dependent oxidoreductase [Pelagovum pacificum]|uniref:FAD-binding oxidoreductase n=1 Tax=Pelagovum pacificum TaxID=2588711 RepID=A0A5C5GBC6_9RHOB|nr:FAD-binding oxidoreductase [Pelagovum pacificum]QQA42186.1 FAD-binding oxidoreductase [Pelagovum pacificum]TNY31272.1 FAD-binding oxidoreductase [Pelagovum pacificum]